MKDNFVKMSMLFADKEHKEFYEEKCIGIKLDPYKKSVIYLLGICDETRKNFDNVIKGDFTEFRPNLTAGWQTDTTQKIVRLAMNLWSGSVYENVLDYEIGAVSKNFAPDEIFACSYAPFFFQAVQLRYPEYCVERGIRTEVYVTNKELEKLDLQNRALMYSRVTLSCSMWSDTFFTEADVTAENIKDMPLFKQFKQLVGKSKIDVNIGTYIIGHGESINAKDDEIECISRNFNDIYECYNISKVSMQTYTEQAEDLDMEL